MRHVMLVVCLAAILLPVASSQGVWTTLASIPPSTAPGTGRVEGPGLSGVGDIVVVAGGYELGLGDNKKLRLYNITTNSWSFGPDMPTARSEPTYGDLSKDGKVYVIGGRTAGAGAKVESYDVYLNVWTPLADMPTARAGAAGAIAGDYIYVMGGRVGGSPCNTPAMATVERYHIPSNTWSTVASLPSPRSDAAAVAHGGKIYIFGGCKDYSPTGSLVDVDVYNPVTDTWSTAPADLPSARAAHMAGIKGNEVYIIGGRNPANGLALPNVDVYDIVKNTWRTDAPMITPRGETSAYSHGGRIYIIGGGQPAYGSSSNANEVFKP